MGLGGWRWDTLGYIVRIYTLYDSLSLLLCLGMYIFFLGKRFGLQQIDNGVELAKTTDFPIPEIL